MVALGQARGRSPSGAHCECLALKSASRAANAPRVYALLRARHEAAGRPEDRWIFPAPTNAEQHITDGLTKFQHRKALDDSGIADFVPYVLRHTALARLGEATGGYVFVLAGLQATPPSQSHKGISIPRRTRSAAFSRRWAQNWAKFGFQIKSVSILSDPLCDKVRGTGC